MPRSTTSFSVAVVLSMLVPLSRASAETHTLVPDHFYTTYSAEHPPVLHIQPGDDVITKTVDAAGVDWTGKAATRGPNPQTGPF